jgi:hypothetical protein
MLIKLELLAGRLDRHNNVKRGEKAMRQTSRHGRFHWSAIMRIHLAVLTLLACASAASGQPIDQSAGTQVPQQWAVLIGCERYVRANPLRYTVNDVRQIAATLNQYGGVQRDHILEMTDTAPNEKRRPLKNNLMAELPEWLSRSGPDDTMIVYFSGHGFRGADGKLYLAPLDINPDDPAATGVSVEWLRQQIANCPANFKLLVIDACHAGSEKGEESKGVASSDLIGGFAAVEKVATIASSREDQVSQIWDDKEQSLFSYWLKQGLKGHADSGDGDGNVDIHELFKYVERQVSFTAERHFARPQRPVRIIRSGIDGVPVVVRLKPQPLKQVLADMAEQLADAVADRKYGKVGVLEFTNITPGGKEVLGANFGLLGPYCAVEIERQLIELGSGKFSVVDRKRLIKALNDQKFGLADLGSAKALQTLSTEAGNMPALAHGTLRGRHGQLVSLECKLTETTGDATIASVGGTAYISESEWAMMGGSGLVKPQDQPPPSVDQPEPDNGEVIDGLDEAAENGPHPAVDSNFPYRVYLKVDDKERPGRIVGRDYVVELKKGEKYQIWIENRTPAAQRKPVMMRVLVDGLNTLPEKLDTKGLVSYEWGRRVNLDEARTWELHPDREKVAIAGFVTKVDNSGKPDVSGEMREFVVTDVEQGLAARQRFTDSVGMITVAFYAAKGGSGRGGISTTAGDAISSRFDAARGYQIGEMLGVVNIRYVDGEAASP